MEESLSGADAVVLRFCRSEEVGVLLEFIRLKAGHDGARGIAATEERLRATMFGERPHAWAVFAEVKGKVAGFALYFFTYSSFQAAPWLWLDDLYVLQERRREGLGTKLMRRVAVEALAAGCHGMQWTTGAEVTNLALPFYLALGAKPVDSRHHGRLHVMALEGEGMRRLVGC